MSQQHRFWVSTTWMLQMIKFFEHLDKHLLNYLLFLEFNYFSNCLDCRKCSVLPQCVDKVHHIFLNFSATWYYLHHHIFSSVKNYLSYERTFVTSEFPHLFFSWPNFQVSRMLEKKKNHSSLFSSAMISMQPSDSEPARISKLNWCINMQLDALSLLFISVACGPYKRHLMNLQSEQCRQLLCPNTYTNI